MENNFKLLEQLIFPITIQDFFDNYWEKKVLYIPRVKENYYDNILSIEDINQYLSRSDIRYPNIRLVQDGRELPIDKYTYDYIYGENIFQGTIDMDKLFYLYKEGATVSFQLLQKSIRKLSIFSNEMERILKFPTQTNLYMTPPNSQGFTAHYDTRSFFILHLHGTKTWKLYNNPYPLPLTRNTEFDDEVKITDDDLTNVITLNEGDFLYIPRGVYHEAYTDNNSSLQITMGLLPYSWDDIIREVITNISDKNIELRKSPYSYIFNSTDNAEQLNFEKILDILRNESNINNVIDSFIAKSHSMQIVDSSNRLNDIHNIKNITLNSKLKKRSINVNITIQTEILILELYDKTISLPISVENEINYIMKQYEFAIKDISNNLDLEDRILLCTKLIEEGLLSIVKI